jgi:predicted nucleotide-binding protein
MCAFAFALMTPDDQVRIDLGKPDARDYYDHPAVQELRRLGQQYAQARPNVIFELGWMYGLLGRDRVCILFKEGTQIYSDLEGIERFVFKQSVNEVTLEIERELKASGLLSV